MVRSISFFLVIVISITTVLSALAPASVSPIPTAGGGFTGSGEREPGVSGSVGDSSLNNDIERASVFYWGSGSTDWYDRFQSIISFILTPLELVKVLYEFFAGFLSIIISIMEPVLEFLLDVMDFFAEVCSPIIDFFTGED